VGKFLAKRGPGMHHIAYQVTDIEATLKQLSEAGLPLIDKTPRVGIGGALVAFLEPKGTGRVLTEIVQPTDGGEH
jgi:methylmalonyl-CoA epimerase